MFGSSHFKGKSVLITGGTGSFGRAFARMLLDEDACSKVIIFSRDEWKQWEMRRSDPLFNGEKARYFLGDVRDSDRLKRAFRGVDIVIHAAALKQVPAAEYNPTEFIQTNIYGAMNVIDQAIERGVQQVIALSTDKSVNPVNLYGATKLCSDKLFIAANSYVGDQEVPKFSVVRYGNVIGSRGSLIPKWKEMIAEGAEFLPITHNEMTRFWVTLDQAVDFVKLCLETMVGEEIFVPKIPSMKIVDIAKALAPDLPIKITGIREGEKLHELLINPDEARYTFELPTHYTLLPPVYKKTLKERQKQLLKESKPVPAGFSYASNTNSEWLSSNELF